MGVFQIILVVLEVIASVGLIAVVLLQSGKEEGLSGAMTGKNDSYRSSLRNIVNSHCQKEHGRLSPITLWSLFRTFFPVNMRHDVIQEK